MYQVRQSDIDYIIFHSRLILLQYLHMLSLCLLNFDDVSFTHSGIRCILEDKITILFFNPILLEDNHRIIYPGLFYLNRCNCAVWYTIDVLSIVSRRDIEGGKTCLVVGSKVRRNVWVCVWTGLQEKWYDWIMRWWCSKPQSGIATSLDSAAYC